MKRKNILKLIKGAIIILCLFFAGTIVVYTVKIITWKLENKETNNQISEILESAVIVEDVDNITTEKINPPYDNLEDPYWKYINEKLINVDFNKLTKINNETKGWLKINGTNVSYPFVQTNNNDFYLNHSFDKSKNSAGWVFLDYRNNIANLNLNTILYAHGRLDNTMFGSIRSILNNGWLANSNNFVIKMVTNKEKTVWQVFSVYHIPTTSDYLQIDFSDNREFEEFLEIIKNRSSYDFKTKLTSDDQIITLSTCYNNTEKIVVHAKLIKRELITTYSK